MARCDSCGRQLCIRCAVPVRGKVLGHECLPAEFLVGAKVPPTMSARGRPVAPFAGVGFALLVFSTALPWSRYNVGSGPFGAWGLTLRWSLVTAVAAAVGIGLWAWSAVRARRTPRWTLIFVGLAAAVGAALDIVLPPAFSTPWIGPWVALVAAAIAIAGSLRKPRRARAADSTQDAAARP